MAQLKICFRKKRREDSTAGGSDEIEGTAANHWMRAVSRGGPWGVISTERRASFMQRIQGAYPSASASAAERSFSGPCMKGQPARWKSLPAAVTNTGSDETR